ncbi:MAG: methyl-accepting chemotaxis protein, partial [Treponema sp.]|nr:methyl-accepting chemotaxis protein [Treponema sp.]
MKKSKSLVFELIILVMVAIYASCILMWTGFFIGMRFNADREIKRFFYETTSHLRDTVDGTLTECSLVLDFTVMGALPIMSENEVDTRQLLDFFQIMEDFHTEIELVYGASLGRWNNPGQYMVFSDEWIPDDPTYDNTEQPWHAGAINGRGRTVFTDPYIDEYTEELVISLVKAISHQNRIIGMAGIDINMSTLNDIANDRSVMEEKRSYIVHPSGLYITNTDYSLIMNTDFFEHNGLQDFRSDVLSSDEFYYDKGETIISSMKVPSSGWIVVTIIPKNEIYNMANRTSIISIVMVLVGTTIMGFIFLVVLRKKIKPIKEMIVELKEIAEGEGDLTKSIVTGSKNEIGDFAHYFNLTIIKIKELVVNIKKESNILSDIGNDLSANMNETAAAINEITANIQSIKGRIINQSASVSETHATMDQVATNINKLNIHVEEQSNHISQASAAIEQMVANIQSVTDTLIKNSANVKNLKDASDIGRGGLQDVASDIQEIARES